MHIAPTLYDRTCFALELENATFHSYDNIARRYLCKITTFGCTFFIHYVKMLLSPGNINKSSQEAE